MDHAIEFEDYYHNKGDSTDENDEIRVLPSALHEMTMPPETVYSKSHDEACSSNLKIDTSGRKNDYSQLGRQRFGAMHPFLVGFSVLVYWTFVSMIPVYNKYFFQKSLFPYPIATAAIQLGIVSLLCAVVNIFQRYFFFSNQNDKETEDAPMTVSIMTTSTATTLDSTHVQSWIFGPHFWWKMKWCFPIGVLFGVKYGVSNLGLHLVSAPTHLLLQSTDLVWTVVGAWSINGERLSIIEIFCLIGCIVGSIFLSWELLSNDSTEEKTSLGEPLYAIAINLTSPILLGLCLSTLRLACTELMRPDNRVGGTVSAIELTSIKLIISSMVGFIMACILERGVKDDTNGVIAVSWWAAFTALSSSTRLGVICGAFLVSVFQVNCTFLTFLTSTVALGIVGQVKIIPQWFFASIVGIGVDHGPSGAMSLSGAILIMLSATGFAITNLMMTVPTKNSPTRHDSLVGERRQGNRRGDEMRTSSPDEKTLLLS